MKKIEKSTIGTLEYTLEYSHINGRLHVVCLVPFLLKLQPLEKVIKTAFYMSEPNLVGKFFANGLQ